MLNFISALHFLTVLRIPGINQDNLQAVGKSLSYFPLAGFVIGILLAGISYLVNPVLPSSISAVIILAALVILTGAHHIDGVADTCDALTVGKTTEQRLAIMSDTRIGTFGIVGVCMTLIIKYAAIEQITQFSVAGLILFPMISRWILSGSIIAFPSAKATGMGYAVKSTSSRAGFIVATIWPLLAAALFYGIFKGVIVMAAMLLLMSLLCLFFTRLFGGLTGDLYGTILESGDILALVLLILFDHNGWLINDWHLIHFPSFMG